MHRRRNQKGAQTDDTCDKEARRPTGTTDVTSTDLITAALARRRLEGWGCTHNAYIDQHTKMLLHYCTTSFWPGFGQGSATFHVPPFALSFDALMEQGPALVNALLWQAAVNLNYKKRTSVKDAKSIRHHHHALTHIARDIKNPVGEIREETMYAILSLACPEMPMDEQDGALRPPKAFNPPLFDLAWIHVFGRGRLVESHTSALYLLVDLRGGIEKLSNPGFRADMNYMDLIQSTQRLCRPHFPLSNVYSRFKREHRREQFFGHLSDFQNRQPDPAESTEVHLLGSFGLSWELQEIMLDMRVWVQVLESYHEGSLTEPDLSLMASHRNLIQHRLLSTLPRNDDDSVVQVSHCQGSKGDTDMGIRGLVQTALLIFSLGVTFPVAYSHPHRLAGKRLELQIRQNFYNLMSAGLHDLLVWLAVLGALCAEQVQDSALKKWYIKFLFIVEQIRAKSSAQDKTCEVIRPWDQVKKVSLEPLLWSSVSCDTMARSIWEDVHAQARMGLSIQDASRTRQLALRDK